MSKADSFSWAHLCGCFSSQNALSPDLGGVKAPFTEVYAQRGPANWVTQNIQVHLPSPLSLLSLFPALSPPTILSHVYLFVASLVSLEWKLLKAKVCDHFLHHLSSVPSTTCLATVDVQEMLEGLSE